MSLTWKNIDLSIVSKTLFVLSIIVLMCVPVDVLAVTFIPSYTASVVRVSNTATTDPLQLNKPEDISVYRQAFKTSKVFGALSTTSFQDAVSIDKIIANLLLKGIITIGTPEAILERKDTHSTAFVQQGDSFQGLTIKDIHRDLVVLSDGADERTVKIGMGS